MAPLAELAFYFGYIVSGSDSTESETTRYLESLNIRIFWGHSAENICSPNATIIYSSAIKDTIPEFQEAKRRGLTIMHRSDFLNEMFSTREYSIAIAGTNGKSTTSSMVSYLLDSFGKDPLAIIGAKSKAIKTLSLHGKGDYSVIEADESDGTFLKYHPHIGVITSIDLDHMDYYHNSEQIYQTFKQFASNTKNHGCIIVCWDNVECRRLSLSLSSSQQQHRQLTYGFHDEAQIRGTQVTCRDGRSGAARTSTPSAISGTRKGCGVADGQKTCSAPTVPRSATSTSGVRAS